MKNYIKVAIIVLMIGWFPLIFVASIGVHNPVYALITIGIVFFVCMMSALALNTYMRNPIYWESIEKLEKLQETYRTVNRQLEQAKNELVEKIIDKL